MSVVTDPPRNGEGDRAPARPRGPTPEPLPRRAPSTIPLRFMVPLPVPGRNLAGCTNG